jgi:hypothetical protein
LTVDEDDLFLIDERKEIRQLIQDDLIDEAISKINDLNPEVISFPLTLFRFWKQDRIYILN